MKLLLVTVVLLAVALRSTVTAQLPTAKKAEFIELLNGIPKTEYLRKHLDLIYHPETGNKEMVEVAQQWVASAKKNLPKLHDFIKVGTSIFDYPGLLTRGDIHYSEPLYTLYFDPSIIADGFPRYEFQITFNERGVITATQREPWRK